MTPTEAFTEIEKHSPVDIKNTLVALLAWQSNHGKTAVINLGWYVRKLKEPQIKMTDDLRKALSGIGKAVPAVPGNKHA